MHRTSVLTVIATLLLIALTVPTAWAGESIGWVYNGDDREARARFRAAGEHVDLCRLKRKTVYVRYAYGDFVPGLYGTVKVYHRGKTGSCGDIDLTLPEGVNVGFQVCQEHRLIADDCSRWHYGRA